MIRTLNGRLLDFWKMLLASQPGSLALLVIFAVAFKEIICHEFIP